MKKTLLILLLLASSAFGQAVGYVGAMENLVTYKYPDTTKKMNYADFVFSYPTTVISGGIVGNFYDTVRGYPHYADSQTVFADFQLDSIGVHGVKVIVRFTDGSTFTDNSGWTCDNRDTVFSSSGGGSGSGTGNYDVRMYAKCGSSYLSRVKFRAVSSGGGTSWYAWSNPSGYAIFALDSGSWLIYGSLPNYGQTVLPDTILVTGDEYDTTTFLPFAIVSQPLGPLCWLYGSFSTFMGTYARGATATVTLFSDSTTVRYGTTAVSKAEQTAKTDTNGIFYLGVYPNSVLSDTLSTYIVRVKYLGATIYEGYVTVPDSVNYEVR